MKHVLLTSLLLLCCLTTARAQRQPTFFARVVAEKPNVIVGDSTLVSILLYSDAEFQSVSCKTKTLRLRGADVHRRSVDRMRGTGRTVYGGRVWNTMLWAQYMVSTDKLGDIKIPEMKFTATLRLYDRPVDPFDDFFGRRRTYRDVEVKAVSEEAKITFVEKPRKTTRELLQGHGHVL